MVWPPQRETWQYPAVLHMRLPLDPAILFGGNPSLSEVDKNMKYT